MTFKINSAKHLFKEHFEDGEHLVNAWHSTCQKENILQEQNV